MAFAVIGQCYKYARSYPGARCIVIRKDFYKVVYQSLENIAWIKDRFAHYKTFEKNWVRIPCPNDEDIQSFARTIKNS